MSSPAHCSGLMNSGVPTTSPARVLPGIRLTCAMPKSATSGRRLSRSMRMFSGLMSRCTTPRAWAYASAQEMDRSSLAASSGAMGPRTLHPPRQGLAVDAGHDEEDQPVDLVGEVDRHDVRVVELGGRARLAQEALAGCRPGSATSGRSSLIATGRSRRTSRARKTSPMPPRPSSDSSEYLPASACCSARKVSSGSRCAPGGMAQCAALTPLP